VLAGQLQARYNEVLYQQALILAALERSTGGAFCAGLLPPAAAPEAGKPAASLPPAGMPLATK
jgi:hypothetical protein